MSTHKVAIQGLIRLPAKYGDFQKRLVIFLKKQPTDMSQGVINIEGINHTFPVSDELIDYLKNLSIPESKNFDDLRIFISQLSTFLIAGRIFHVKNLAKQSDDQNKKKDLYLLSRSLKEKVFKHEVNEMSGGNSWIKSFQGFIESEINYIHRMSELNKSTSSQNSTNDFIWWRKSSEMLQHLLSVLMQKGLIGEENIDVLIFQHFIDQNRNLYPEHSSQQTTKIWWKSTARLLKYLMDHLGQHQFIPDDTINKYIKDHFIDVNKKQFSNSIAQNASGMSYNNNICKPRGNEKIDEIIATLVS